MSFDVAPSYDHIGVGQCMCVPYRAVFDYYGFSDPGARICNTVQFRILFALQRVFSDPAHRRILVAIRDP